MNIYLTEKRKDIEESVCKLKTIQLSNINKLKYKHSLTLQYLLHWVSVSDYACLELQYFQKVSV